MMKLLATALSASLVLLATGLPLPAAAAGNKTASSGMQVSFVVKEACTVQTAAGPARVTGGAATAAATPAVACELNTPYLLTRGADRPAAAINGGNAATDRPAAPIRTESGAQSWVVYF